MTNTHKYIVTSALPYANGPLHIGHIAGAYLPADLYVRFLRHKKNLDVKFICGTDEHGVPITIRAKKEGKSPKEVVDFYHENIKKSFEGLKINFDVFSRTSSDTHHRRSQSFFKKLYDNGVFEEHESEQYYDQSTQQFLADRYITGRCPNCSYENAYGDQCESCGKSLSPLELINPKSALSGRPPILKKTKNWYLPLDKLQSSFLDSYIEGLRTSLKPHVYGQCKSWLNEGLKPRAMTRDLNWGIKVPVEGADGKVLYVWFDAPIGYISMTEELTEKWTEYWQDEKTELIHFIGKDNIVFHCLIFPAMLHAHGDFILPKYVPANEFLNLEGKKISTSRNHAIWVNDYLKDFPHKVDELRYVLTSIMPENSDADFTWKDFQARVNNELVAILGNFINRVLVLSHKYFEGYVAQGQMDITVESKVQDLAQKIDFALSNFEFRQANTFFIDLARLGNKYLQEQEPWKKWKEENLKPQVRNCLFTCLKLVEEIKRQAQIFLPNTAEKIKNTLNLSNAEVLSPKHKLNKPMLLFEKIEDAEIQIQIDKLLPKKENKPMYKEEIQFDDFEKIDLRVGTIIEAKKMEKADKLLTLQVDMGGEIRTIISGIAHHFSPNDVLGQQVTVVCNLAPRKIRGFESQGMILMSEDLSGQLQFNQPSVKVANGSKVN
ncbi:MAG: methionine--tRNA ligase [Bacteroidetes bacterium TMED39]|nr:MAG: methionine--tRNA ligase [Bacteroidetes bacterium TMED39]